MKKRPKAFKAPALKAARQMKNKNGNMMRAKRTVRANFAGSLRKPQATTWVTWGAKMTPKTTNPRRINPKVEKRI